MPNTAAQLIRDSAVVSVALVVSGLLSYGYLVLPARTGRLDPAAYSPLAALWFALFTVGSGLLVPLEQELTRSVADRRDRPERDRNEQVTAALIVGLSLTVVLAVVAVALRSLVRAEILAGSDAMLWVLVAALPGFLGFELVRGTLAGRGRFGWYATTMILDSGLRFGIAVLFVIAGSVVAWQYGLGMVVGMAGAAVIGFGVTGFPLVRVSSAVVSDFVQRFWPYALSQLFAQLAINSPVLLGVALAGPSEADVAARVGSTLVLVRTPLYLLPALTAPLLPRLTEATRGNPVVSRLLRRVISIMLAATFVAALGAAVAGPWVAGVVFGEAFALPGAAVGLLTAGSGLFAVASILSIVLLAEQRPIAILVSWTIGLAGAVLVALLVADLVTAVSLSFVIAMSLGVSTQLISIRSMAVGASH